MTAIRGYCRFILEPAKRACEQIPQDIGYGLRTLRRNPGFAAVAILTLALGTGVNTAVFSVVNAVLLRPLPYPDADRLVALSNATNGANPGHFKPGILGADFAAWQGRATSFEKIAGYFYEDATLATPDRAYQARVISIAGDFWPLTGAYPALGTLFEARDSTDSIVLSYSLFQRQFKADPAIIGKVVTLDGQPRTVTGVLPAAFRFQFAQNWWSWLAATEPGAFIPAPPPVRSEQSRLFVVGRLKPLVSAASALAEIRGIETAILKSDPDRWFPGVSRMTLVPLETQLVGSNRQGLLILQVAGVFVLLIACANIASLLLARGAARVHEMGIRAAIGAGATRILRQFLVEGIVLALLGGAAGLLVGKLLISVLIHFGANAIPRLQETLIDLRVLTFTFGISLGSGIVFGFGPALALRTENLQDILKQGARTLSVSAGGGAGGFSVRRFLVGSELALAIVLLTGAGLMVKSFWKMYANPPGFAPENTLVMKIGLSGPQYKDTRKQVTYLTELQNRLRSMPGVKALGIANIQDYIVQSKDNSAAVDQFRETLASADYFQAIGMRLLKGRWFTDSDAPDATIINETMARRVCSAIKIRLARRLSNWGVRCT